MITEKNVIQYIYSSIASELLVRSKRLTTVVAGLYLLHVYE